MFKKILHPGMLILIGFAGMLIFFIVIFIKTNQSNVQMVTEDYYEKELAFQDDIDAIKRANNYDSTFSVQYRNGIVIITLPQELNTHLDTLNAFFYNKSNSKKDKKMWLDKNTSGIYNVKSEFCEGQRYQVRIDLVSDGKRYIKELDIN